MGFTRHFHIIFGTNLLTRGPTQIVVFFAYFSVSKKRNIKRNETFGNVIFETNVIQRTWSGRQAINKAAMRQGARPSSSWLNRPTSCSYICSHTPKISRSTMKPYFHRRNLLYPRDPILGPFPELRRRGIDHGGLLDQHHSLSDDV